MVQRLQKTISPLYFHHLKGESHRRVIFIRYRYVDITAFPATSGLTHLYKPRPLSAAPPSSVSPSNNVALTTARVSISNFWLGFRRKWLELAYDLSNTVVQKHNNNNKNNNNNNSLHFSMNEELKCSLNLLLLLLLLL